MLVRAIMLLSLSLSGCGGTWPDPVNVHQMALPLEETARFNGNTPLAGKVALGTVATEENRKLFGGGTDTRIVEFREALGRSLDESMLAADDQAGFTLHAVVTGVEPGAGSETFALRVTYVLVRASDGAPVLRETIATSHTATKSDTTHAGYRQLLSINGAFQKNIVKVIELLYGTNK